MGLISKVVKPNYIPTKEDICATRTLVGNFTIFTKIDPPDVLAYYLDKCNEEGVDPLVDPFDLPNTCLDARGEGTSGPKKKKKKKKVAMFLDEYDVPLSECRKAIILKDASGVV